MSKVLIIDDDGPIREFLKNHFEGRGHKVITAEDGKEGLAKAESKGPDLIKLDMNMPVMTGWDAARELKKEDAATALIPIIALTAQKTLDDQIEAHESGYDAFVEKPIDPDRLFDAVDRILK